MLGLFTEVRWGRSVRNNLILNSHYEKFAGLYSPCGLLRDTQAGLMMPEEKDRKNQEVKDPKHITLSLKHNQSSCL